MPVNRPARRGRRPRTADVQPQLRRRLGVLLVVCIFVNGARLDAVGEPGRMARAAGLERRPEVGGRRRNRPRVVAADHVHELPDTGQLRADQRPGPFSHVTLDARHVGMRGVLPGGELRPHRRVARLPAEGRRLHPVQRAVPRDEEDDGVDGGQRHHRQDRGPHPPLSQIDHRPPVGGSRIAQARAALQPDADWNEEQDAGRSLSDATELLVKQFPAHETSIRAYYGRWTEMLGGPIAGTVEVLKQLKESKKYKLYALTNWSAETFPVALERYDFLHWFDGRLVSGAEKTRKPFKVIYELLINRFGIDPTKSIYTDDNIRNLHPARELGMHTIHFRSPEQFKEELKQAGISASF